MYGVSAAYFISKYGTGFTLNDQLDSLQEIKALGFDSVQLELFTEQRLSEWNRYGSFTVRNELDRAGLVCTQFVAHFMGKVFERPADKRFGMFQGYFSGLLDSLSRLPDMQTVCIPLPGFQRVGPMDPSAAGDIQEQALRRISAVQELARDHDLETVFEVMPGSVFGGYSGFINTLAAAGMGKPGLCLDTGHIHAAGESIPLVIGLAGGSVLSTHLCDNFGLENMSDIPGNGNIDWKNVFGTLKRCGYSGSYDIEIICKPDEVAVLYTQGLEFVRTVSGGDLNG